MTSRRDCPWNLALRSALHNLTSHIYAHFSIDPDISQGNPMMCPRQWTLFFRRGGTDPPHQPNGRDTHRRRHRVQRFDRVFGRLHPRLPGTHSAMAIKKIWGNSVGKSATPKSSTGPTVVGGFYSVQFPPVSLGFHRAGCQVKSWTELSLQKSIPGKEKVSLEECDLCAKSWDDMTSPDQAEKKWGLTGNIHAKMIHTIGSVRNFGQHIYNIDICHHLPRFEDFAVDGLQAASVVIQDSRHLSAVLWWA